MSSLPDIGPTAGVRPPWLDEVERLESLQGVLRWAFARTPPAEVVDVVAQDEFTHDVIVRVSDRAYLAFDTT
jgi:hypothetical protein